KIFGLKRHLGDNINGPSLIRVPGWVEKPLGKYYLYFGHHGGQYIRLAYSDSPEGPYKLYKPGVLRKKETFIQDAEHTGRRSHLASPDLLIEQETKTLRMYFHANIRGTGIYSDQSQTSYLATSKDGLDFKADPTLLGPFYMKVFKHDGYYYSIAKNHNKGGILVRSKDGKSLFERGHDIIEGFRHCALLQRGNTMYIFFTRAFEMPESILLSEMDLGANWMDWEPTESKLVLKPELDWEGANLPLTMSRWGGTGVSNHLRDPCIFEEEGKVYLLYCFKGEGGIAIARIEGI
ncbi:MAG: hypothetical protein ACFFCS_12805, partial [Candidatus Hodarchaeota archaeon]